MTALCNLLDQFNLSERTAPWKQKYGLVRTIVILLQIFFLRLIGGPGRQMSFQMFSQPQTTITYIPSRPIKWHGKRYGDRRRIELKISALKTCLLAEKLPVALRLEQIERILNRPRTSNLMRPLRKCTTPKWLQTCRITSLGTRSLCPQMTQTFIWNCDTCAMQQTDTFWHNCQYYCRATG